jgi:OOP family OmpA-OmpF porin
MRIVICALAFLLFGAAAVHGPYGAARISKGLKERVESALRESRLDWAQVDVDGRRVALAGIAPDEEARRRAVAIAAQAVGPPFAPEVDARRLVARPIAPPEDPAYRFEALFRDGVLTVSGATPSEAARDAVIAAFARSEPFEVRLATQAVPVADDDEWRRAVGAALAALSLLDEGEVRQRGRTIAVTGVAATDAAADGAESLIAGADGGYAIRGDVERRAPIDVAAACQSAVNRTANGRPIVFARESAALNARDRALLDELAAAMRACANLTVIIEGHTDASGGAAFNLALSERRARAVKDYLERAGTPARLEIRAYGASRPIASNRTEEGRRRNRRIDILAASAGGKSD